jgi:hypothetical protein
MVTLINDDVWEIIKTLGFAFCVGWVPFVIFEIYIPAVDELVRYEMKCNEMGGFVYSEQNKEKICISRESIIIVQ